MNRLEKYVKTALCVMLSVTMLLMDVPTAALAMEETLGQTQETAAEEIIDGTDTDTGADTDTGTNTGTGSGTDTDAGSGGDTDTDTDAGSEGDTDTDTDTGSGSDTDTDIDARSDTSTDIGADMDAETETETDMDADVDSDKKGTAAEVSVMNDDLSVEAANGLGSLIMDELQLAAQEGQSEAQAGYAISEITVSGSTAEVTLHATTSCTVIVSIYEENSDKPLVFGSSTVEVGESKVRVQFETDQMPQYFVVKGHIVDTAVCVR